MGISSETTWESRVKRPENNNLINYIDNDKSLKHFLSSSASGFWLPASGLWSASGFQPPPSSLWPLASGFQLLASASGFQPPPSGLWPLASGASHSRLPGRPTRDSRIPDFFRKNRFFYSKINPRQPREARRSGTHPGEPKKHDFFSAKK